MKSHYIAWVYLLMLTTQVNAGTTDLSIEFIADIAEGVEIGEVGSFTLAVTNHGPDPAGVDSIHALPVWASSSPLWLPLPSTVDVFFQIDPDVNQNCALFSLGIDPPPNTPPHYRLSARFPAIQPNETVFCQGLYTVGHLDPSKVIEIKVGTPLEDTDPNEDNNTVVVVFGLPPAVIPVNAWMHLLMLVGLLMAFAARRLQRSNGP